MKTCIRTWLATGLVWTCTATVYGADSVAKLAAATKVALGAIVVDGKLDDAGWKDAPVQTGFERLTSMANRENIASNMQTSFQVAWDDGTLYVGVQCREPNVAGMRPYPAPEVWDAAMWANDCIELFFNPTGARDGYYHFAAGPNGAQYDAYWPQGRFTHFSSAWRSKAVIGKDEWTLEFAIPFAALNGTPASTWSNTWALSVCRTAPASSGNTMYSPTEGFHKFKQSGSLGGMPAGLAAYNLECKAATFRLEPDDHASLAAAATLAFCNRGATAFEGTVSLEVAGKDAPSFAPLSLAPGATCDVHMPPAMTVREGALSAVIRVKDARGREHLVVRRDEVLTYVPMAIQLTAPAYRGAIYGSQRGSFKRVRGRVSLGMRAGQLAGTVLHVQMQAVNTNKIKDSVDIPVQGREVDFELNAEWLKAVDYRIEAELRRTNATPEAAVIARAELIMPSYPAAPDVEVRVDEEGSLLVNGQPLIIRGFYGGISTLDANFHRLPHAINYMNGDSATLWCLVDAKGCIDENAAKTDPPLDADMTNKLMGVVGSTRGRKNVIGYYLEEDSGGRGVPSSYLKKVYDFLRAADPYRMVMLTESPDPANLAACDVLCPRQWQCIVEDETGTRRFGSELSQVGETVSQAFGTPGKALWCGPQAFAYAEESGDARRRHLNLVEQRYVMLNCLVRGARGFTCHTMWDYINNMSARITINSVYDELAWLDAFWCQSGNAAVVSVDNPSIRVGARTRRFAEGAPLHHAIIAINESYTQQTAVVRVEGVTDGRLAILRENRSLAVTNGCFTDAFAPLEVHVYTTIGSAPVCESPAAVAARIHALAERAIASGNLLAQPGLRYRVSGSQFNCDGTRPDTGRFQYVDGNLEESAWNVWNDDNIFVVDFEIPATFNTVSMTSPTLLGGTLEAKVAGRWIQLKSWEDHDSRQFDWTGDAVTASAIRFTPTKTRMGHTGAGKPSISELGVYMRAAGNK